MPNPAGLGALAATLNFFPIIGPVAMFVILAVVGVIAFSTLGAGLIARTAFVGVTFLEGHFVTPTIIGRRLELNALAVFMALAFWTWLWGPMGGFLSSPLLIVALVLKEHLMPVDVAATSAGLTGFSPQGTSGNPARWLRHDLSIPGALDVEYGWRNRNEKSDG